MHIHMGNNSKIKNSNFIEKANIKVEEKTKDGFWKQVFVNIMSNFLWKVLGLLISFGLLVALAMSVNNH
ncbi:MAG: hypothetical protein ACLU84_07605 [Clostridia bacterium]